MQGYKTATWNTVSNVTELLFCRQRKAEEDTQQSSHKEQVDALWQRLEDAATAHKEEVQQSQQQLQDASRTHEQAEQEWRQMTADASCAQEQEVRELLQRLEEAYDTHRQQLGDLQQQHEEEVDAEGKRHKAALSQVRLHGRGRPGGRGCESTRPHCRGSIQHFTEHILLAH